MPITDELLDFLAEQFRIQGFLEKGWLFHEFVTEYQAGYVVIA